MPDKVWYELMCQLMRNHLLAHYYDEYINILIKHLH